MKLTDAQINLLRAVDACRDQRGNPIYYMRPLSDYWYEARPDNAKINRLIARGLLQEHKGQFISLTEAGRAALRQEP